MKPPFKLLILEDNADDILLLKEMMAEIDTYDLTHTTFDTTYLETLNQGIQYLNSHPVDLILLDLSLPDSQALDTLRTLRDRKEAQDIPIIIFTTLDDKKAGIEAVKMGAQEFLVKSDVTARSLMISIRYAIERQQLKLKMQKETEELQQSETQFIEIITNTPDSVVIVDAHKKIRFMNPAAENLLGQKSRKLLGNPFEFPIVEDESQSKEIEIARKDGTVVTAEMRSAKIEWQAKDSWLISLRDITRKKKLLQAFQEEKEQLDVTLRSIADGVIAADEKGIIGMINWMATQMTGCLQEQAVGKPLAEVLKLKNKTSGDFLVNPGENTLETGETIESTGTSDWVLISGDNSEIPCEFSCAPVLKEKEVIGAILVVRDITEKKELEEELIRAQNLEALGVLAAGIAHQYNNILTAALGYISLAKMVLGEENKIFPRLKKAEEAGLRAKEISYRLFTFAKGGEPQKRKDSITIPLEQAVQETLETKYPYITVEWDIVPGLWPVSYDPDQVRLAIRNILINAAESMLKQKKRKITIKVENIKIPGKKSSMMKRGNYVKISITDQGTGIAEEHLPKIFDAYFSTKKNAEGMGLTTAYSIIRKHGGWIRARSKNGKGLSGTTITLLLPASVTSPPQDIPAISISKTPEEAEPSTVKKKRILVMDDEDLVREIAQEMLEFLEYDTALAEDGEEALELYRAAMESRDSFAAVILDLIIPSGMGGKECIEKLLAMDPNVNAIISSGYSDDPVIADYAAYGFRGILPKPYKIHELNEVLEKLK